MADSLPTGFITVDGAPLLGSMLPISRDALSFFTRVLRDRGDRVRLRVPGRRILLLCHPDDMEQVLVRDRASYGRSAEILKLRPIFGDGLLASEGELWRRQRSLIQPTFAHDALTRYAEIMRHTIDRRLAEWRAGQTIDIHAEMMRYTREVICEVLFGEAFLAGRAGLGEAVSTVFGDLRSEILYLPVWRRLPLPRAARWNRAVAVLNGAVREAIQERVRSGANSNDMLGALLAARDADGNGMDPQQLHDEILTFFLAGHETAALALTWSAYLLAMNRAAQERVRDEALGTGAEYGRLRWTGAVVKEAMRLDPPVWSMGREVASATTLGGEALALGTDVWLCVHRLHRDPRWWEEPNEFLPERWIEQPTPRPFTYLPFGMGPRVCIGQHFAQMEAVLGVAAMAARFRFELASGPAEPSAWITLRPKTPIRLRLAD